MDSIQHQGNRGRGARAGGVGAECESSESGLPLPVERKFKTAICGLLSLISQMVDSIRE